MDGERRYQQARQRVRALRGLYLHLAVYLLVNAVLFLVNALTPGTWWFFWPLIGWGVGLSIHATVTLGLLGMLGPEWEERKIRELMGRGAGTP